MTDKEAQFEVSFSGGTRYDIAEVRRRMIALMPDGKHAWVISTIFALDDPDEALDTMDLNAEKFVGVTNIHCLLCPTDYKPGRRDDKCIAKDRYTCRFCGRASRHPDDVADRYCGACHRFGGSLVD
jgi:hypothetical protein